MLATLTRRKTKRAHYNGVPVDVVKRHNGADTTWLTVECASGKRMDVPCYLIDWK